jgi:hypothetical protein
MNESGEAILPQTDVVPTRVAARPVKIVRERPEAFQQVRSTHVYEGLLKRLGELAGKGDADNILFQLRTICVGVVNAKIGERQFLGPFGFYPLKDSATFLGVQGNTHDKAKSMQGLLKSGDIPRVDVGGVVHKEITHIPAEALVLHEAMAQCVIDGGGLDLSKLEDTRFPTGKGEETKSFGELWDKGVAMAETAGVDITPVMKWESMRQTIPESFRISLPAQALPIPVPA